MQTNKQVSENSEQRECVYVQATFTCSSEEKIIIFLKKVKKIKLIIIKEKE